MGGTARGDVGMGEVREVETMVVWDEVGGVTMAKRFEAEGFERGRGAPTVFWNRMTKVGVVVHGDDFTMSGEKQKLEAMKGEMQEWCEIKDMGYHGKWSGENS